MKGFTLVESIVTIMVVSIMASLILASYGDLRERTVLNRYVKDAALNVRKAQNLTTSIVRQSGDVPCGYGIHYTSQYSYVLFANSQDGLSSDCSDSNKDYDSSDAIISEIKLDESNIKFYSSFSDIVFLPPDPITFIGGLSNPTSKSTISICLKRSCASFQRQIIVWGSGLIDIE